MVRNHRPNRIGTLLLGLALHGCFVLVYLAVMLAVADVSAQLSPQSLGWATLTGVVSAGWFVVVCGCVWLIALVNLIRWWRQGRTRLVSSTVAWDLLLWLGPFLALLVRWKPARTVLVPRPVPD
jgi:hypothetical protein